MLLKGMKYFEVNFNIFCYAVFVTAIIKKTMIKISVSNIARLITSVYIETLPKRG